MASPRGEPGRRNWSGYGNPRCTRGAWPAVKRRRARPRPSRRQPTGNNRPSGPYRVGGLVRHVLRSEAGRPLPDVGESLHRRRGTLPRRVGCPRRVGVTPGGQRPRRRWSGGGRGLTTRPANPARAAKGRRQDPSGAVAGGGAAEGGSGGLPPTACTPRTPARGRTAAGRTPAGCRPRRCTPAPPRPRPAGSAAARTRYRGSSGPRSTGRKRWDRREGIGPRGSSPARRRGGRGSRPGPTSRAVFPLKFRSSQSWSQQPFESPTQSLPMTFTRAWTSHPIAPRVTTWVRPPSC